MKPPLYSVEMKILYQEPNTTIYCGHALDLRELPAESVDMCMTSPPYWGLRSYKTEPQIWDSKDGCRHEWGNELEGRRKRTDGDIVDRLSKEATKSAAAFNSTGGQFCSLCGAWRGELGLEPTIELYIKHLIQIFNEVKRVLKKTGTCWVNIDDSYAGSGGPGGDFKDKYRGDDYCRPYNRNQLPAKSLCLIPSRFALAMVESGWVLRNDIVWEKPNPMPESVKDRFTGSWEHLFFFAKSKRYFFEQQFEPMAYPDRVFNPDISGHITAQLQQEGNRTTGGLHDGRTQYGNPELGRNKRDVWGITTESFGMEMCLSCGTIYESSQFRKLAEKPSKKCVCELGEIPIWETIPFVGYQCGYCNIVYDRFKWDKLNGANTKICRCGESNWLSHFATFPEKLCETPILAGCPSMICKRCGKARERIYEATGHINKREPAHVPNNCPTKVDSTGWDYTNRPTGEYTDCGCNTGFEPGVALDPFMGSGTTLAVAKRLGRKGIGIDISEDYCKLAVKRIQGISLPMEFN